MKVVLTPEENDLVFWVQGTKFLPRGSFILEGIHKNGEDKWEGILPNDDVYEIYVNRPPVSNSRMKRTLPFRLSIAVAEIVDLKESAKMDVTVDSIAPPPALRNHFQETDQPFKQDAVLRGLIVAVIAVGLYIVLYKRRLRIRPGPTSPK